jgi:hypothetical protein
MSLVNLPTLSADPEVLRYGWTETLRITSHQNYIQAELNSPPPGADVAGLKAFLEWIRASLPINV